MIHQNVGLPRELRILLLEGVHESAASTLSSQGAAEIEREMRALGEDELIDRLRGVHLLGIRSRTRISSRVLAAADQLVAVGCFCIGTNQVDLPAARRLAIPVFNAPFSNTRSVAELVMGEIVMLMRNVFPKSQAAHLGRWLKATSDSVELRGKVLGIVGYGNIGSQLGIIAEAGFGMQVRYFDVVEKLPIGNARPVESLEQLLKESDVLSIHVPGIPQTRGMIGENEIAAIRHKGFLINASRGDVVDVDALAAAIRGGHLRGAAVDVFPVEPRNASDQFECALRGLPNVILTPHIAGSTLEAQERIGIEVGRKLLDYNETGSTVGAVNFPNAFLPMIRGNGRFLHAHENTPGVLAQITSIISGRGINIVAQHLQTDNGIGYAAFDTEGDCNRSDIIDRLRMISGTLCARSLTPTTNMSPGPDLANKDKKVSRVQSRRDSGFSREDASVAQMP